MIKTFFAAVFFAMLAMTGAVTAQQDGQNVVWVQIEAHPSLSVAQSRAQVYSSRIADVNGFSLGGNWYGILLGPYLREDAERVLQVYRSDRLIPQDSFIAFSRNLGAQYWPEGGNVLAPGVVTTPAEQSNPQQDATNQPDPEPSDETPAEARRSERLLTSEERKDLQIAMRAGGFYNSTIDGAFGAGTRRAMADWQFANGYEGTGILTTAQRAALMDQYNAPLISVGMRSVRDDNAGIEMDMPAGSVRFSKYEPPFAHYDATGDLGVKVLLISQPGTQATLYGLYDIMQTLEIVPLNGARERGNDWFTLEGRGKEIVSYTEARLQDGEIKGFTLIWPVGDEERRIRVLDEMKASFSRTDGVLSPAAGGETVQDVDLVSGLVVRKPRVSRSGFYIDTKGTVVTTSDVVQGCSRITLDEEYRADLLTSDTGLGVAVLRPVEPLAPLSVARFRSSEGRLQSEVTVAGFSYEGVLGAPTLTYGILADVKGLKGESELSRLALNALPGDAGGPVIDAGGGVLGMLLPVDQAGRKLPENVSFVADAAAIRLILENAGVTPESLNDGTDQPLEDMPRMASGMTVLVSCWD